MSRKLRAPAALAIIVLVGAGCSNGSADKDHTGTASSGGNKKLTKRDKAVKFAECIRAHGVSDFPDPNEKNQFEYRVSVSPAYAQNRGWRLGNVRVDVRYDADVTPRQVEIGVHLPDGLTPDQVERLRRVADTCPARRALEAGFVFDQQLTVDIPEAVPARTEAGRQTHARRAASGEGIDVRHRAWRGRPAGNYAQNKDPASAESRHPGTPTSVVVPASMFRPRAAA
jgi:hypothetical protein